MFSPGTFCRPLEICMVASLLVCSIDLRFMNVVLLLEGLGKLPAGTRHVAMLYLNWVPLFVFFFLLSKIIL
jgi:hypothetical protein